MVKLAAIALARREIVAARPVNDDGADAGITGRRLDGADQGLPTAAIPAPPAEIQWIAHAIGAEATLRLVEAFAGRRTYIPIDPGPDCLLSYWIGQEAALAIAAIRGGETIKIPSQKGWRARVYRARGMSVSDIASTLGVDHTTAQRYLNPIVSHLASNPDHQA